jgi:ATP-dependent Clp protease ATP-binding subunit ClpA
MFRRFTVAARNTVVRAKEEAQALHHPNIGSEHLLLALADPDAGLAHRILAAVEITPERIRTELAKPQPGTLDEEDAAALRTIGIDLDVVLAQVKETFGAEALHPAPQIARSRWPWGRGTVSSSRFTPQAKKVLELALREAIRLDHNYLGTEHLLLALLRDGSGRGAQLLASAGLSLKELRELTEAAMRTAE